MSTSMTTTATTLTTTTTIFTSMSTTTMTMPSTTSKTLVSVPDALYVCIGTNLLAHVLSMIFAFLCTRNFGQGLKERVFNNRFDKWFQKRSSNAQD